jgi:dihydropteroate synthase
MGIVNVTPDSFSDGGQFFDPQQAVAHALEMMEQGAEILDVGGESSRPGAEPVSEAEELRRVIPVIEQLARKARVPISIDTVKPAVARAALIAGASIVNDVGANRTDAAMWHIVAETGAGYICMHMRGNPQTMQVNPAYQDVVREVGEFFSERLARLKDSGVAAEQVALDPGIGFGKLAEHNLQLLAALGIFKKLERPLVLGVSRKSFIGKIVATESDDRLAGSLACASLAVEAGVEVVRVHDVAETLQAVRVTEAIVKRRG